MIRFVHPEAWLLIVPIALVLRRQLWPDRWLGALRVSLVVAALAWLAGPWWQGAVVGRDVVLVVDRSQSAPQGLLDRAEEVARRLVADRRPGDRIGVVLAGREPRVLQPPIEAFRWLRPEPPPDADGTDLAAAIEAAAALVPEGRRGSIVVLSDGLHTGGADGDALARVQRRGLHVDVVPLVRSSTGDVSVVDVAIPAEVAAGEPFRFSAWVRSPSARTVSVRLWRDGEVLAEGQRPLEAGDTRLALEDRIPEPGVHHYTVELVGLDDRVPETDTARAVVTAVAPFRVLCVTPEGREDAFTAALRAVGIDVVAVAPGRAPLDANALEGFAVVVLEDVAATDLPAGGMEALRHWVEERGGGLLMTGGARSFGAGGYRRSPLEALLPVSMEVRDEQRVFALAMAMALDVSGSMRVAVEDGRTKLQLAVAGAKAAVDVLGPADAVAAFSVDTGATEVLPRTELSDPSGVMEKLESIRHGGGGIFIEPALAAAHDALAAATQANRHLVLFADAADSKSPGDFEAKLAAMRRDNITVSVIGLGSEGDPDAELLRAIAALGGGRLQFVEDALDLPRRFIEEAVQVTGSTMVAEPTPVAAGRGLARIGDFSGVAWPDLGGRSVVWPRPGAAPALVLASDSEVPLLAAWGHGLGRVAAFAGEVDGAHTGAWSEWGQAPAIFSTWVRYLGGALAGPLVGRATRRGTQLEYSAEVGPGDEAVLAGARLRIEAPDGSIDDRPLRWMGPRRRAVELPLDVSGVYRAVIALADGGVVRLPAAVLPSGPEFAVPLDADAGRRWLARWAEATGGVVDPPMAELWRGTRQGRGVRDLAPWLAWFLVVGVLGEIAFRRFRPARATPNAPPRRRRLTRRRSHSRDDRRATDAPAGPTAADEEALLDVLDRMRDR